MPRTYKQRAYDQRRHYRAVNRGTKPMIGCLLPGLALLGFATLLLTVL